METADFQRYLSERYEDQINWYDKKSIWNQKLYRYFQWSVIVLAAVTPVLVAIAPDTNRWPAVIVATLVAIGTGGLKTFKYQENWINYRTTCETLKKEIHFYRAGLGDYRESEDREALFIERVESLISRENTMWITAQRPKEKEDSSA
ncbi:MAG: DUF4231 domain-containing protein [Sedimentisphaerales bacterium]|nr:DUF4231 domain-containing protein [Sedimentisphaerales bacterium]